MTARYVMWEAQASPDRLDELLAWVTSHADPAGQIYCSADQGRVVAIAAEVTELDRVPAELLTRPANSWVFDKVQG